MKASQPGIKSDFSVFDHESDTDVCAQMLRSFTLARRRLTKCKILFVHLGRPVFVCRYHLATSPYNLETTGLRDG